MQLSLVFFLAFFVLLGCTRSDNFRIRALAPMQEQSSANNLVSAEKSDGAITSSGIRTTGRSYSVVFRGLSVGFTEITTDRSIRSKAGNEAVLDEFFTTNAKYNELGVMIGDDFTLTLGVGGNNFKASLRSSNTSLETLVNAGSLSYSPKSFSRQTTQVTAGLGISF